jgi:hypothetical protein
MTIPNTDVTGGQGGTKERLRVGERFAAVYRTHRSGAGCGATGLEWGFVRARYET